jgi:hypothetical protein
MSNKPANPKEPSPSASGEALRALVGKVADEVQARGRKHATGEPLFFDRHNLERAIEAALAPSGETKP